MFPVTSDLITYKSYEYILCLVKKKYKCRKPPKTKIKIYILHILYKEKSNKNKLKRKVKKKIQKEIRKSPYSYAKYRVK